MSEYDYKTKSDLDIARHINLAMLLCSGISEENAGFDMVTTINDKGLTKIAEIIGKVRSAERDKARNRNYAIRPRIPPDLGLGEPKRKFSDTFSAATLLLRMFGRGHQ